MTGASSPNQVGGGDGGTDQQRRASRGAVGGGGAISVGGAGGHRDGGIWLQAFAESAPWSANQQKPRSVLGSCADPVAALHAYDGGHPTTRRLAMRNGQRTVMISAACLGLMWIPSTTSAQSNLRDRVSGAIEAVQVPAPATSAISAATSRAARAGCCYACRRTSTS
jgi:hypothetical protein